MTLGPGAGWVPGPTILGRARELAMAVVANDPASANALEVKFAFCPFCEIRIFRMRRDAENTTLVQHRRLCVVTSAYSQRATL